jgi:hypothetical protein
MIFIKPFLKAKAGSTITNRPDTSQQNQHHLHNTGNRMQNTQQNSSMLRGSHIRLKNMESCRRMQLTAWLRHLEQLTRQNLR